ncbi:MAG: thiamine pyrophosphate-dependent enzyme, partial [Acidipropionibacterium jensenii]|nr:thiamine pyrophosphate-dependent enzyme [Acidipropionibacterium jensenii]
MVQILSPQGVWHDHPDYPIQLSADQLRQALERLVIARRLDLEGTNLQRHGELSLWPPLRGQEATQAGAIMAVGPHDQVFPSYREQALAHWMGVTLPEILATWRGSAICPWDTVATRCSAYPVMIGAGALHGVGYAMGIQRDGMTGHDDPSTDAAALLFHGDGGMSEGDVSESYVFAAANQAPIVFCCVNNQYAISERTTVSARTSLFRRAAGFGIH